MRRHLVYSVILLLSCAKPQSVTQEKNSVTESTLDATSEDASATDSPSATPDSAVAQIDPDGNDDRGGAGSLPPHGHFERVGRSWASLLRICDLRPFKDALYAAHATMPLGVDGATITRMSKSTLGDGGTKKRDCDCVRLESTR